MTWTGKWNGERVTGVKGPLVAEFMARVLKFGKPTQGTGRNGVQAVMVDHQLQKPYVFREYLNHMFQESYTYDELMQGMVRSSRAKVQFGMQKYRLMRSVKYGNVCRDCAATLDMAPGLYYRTGRVSAESSLIKDQVRPGMRQLDTWWLGLKDKPMKIGGQQLKDADGNPKLFDPWFLYLMTSGPSAPARGPAKEGPSRAHVKQQLKLSEDPRAGKIVQKRTDFGKDAALEVLWGKGKWEKELEVHLDAVAEFMHVRNCQLRDGSAKRVPITKLHKPPEVYTQKV